MRILTFLWFWHVAWDDEKPFSMILTFLLPVVPILLALELLLLVFNKQLSKCSLLMMCSFTTWLNESFLKTLFGAINPKKSNEVQFDTPSTLSLISFSILTLYSCRAFKGKKDLISIILWGAGSFFIFISMPVLGYLSWAFAFTFLIGIGIGFLWWTIVEVHYFCKFLLTVQETFHLVDDVQGDPIVPASDLSPSSNVRP